MNFFDSLIINPMVNALLWIYSVVGNNFGLAIILFTILIRLITYPLTAQQFKASKAMQEMQGSKRMQEIQKKFKDDKEKLAQEQMKLYQEMGVSPFASCLPTLIQFPIIIGLYQAIMRALAAAPLQLLNFSEHIYPFIDAANLIPLNSQFLWMDMSQPERLMILGFGVPTLAILVVITTYLQTKLMTPPSANPSDQSAQMTKMMNLYMPFLMGFFAYQYASGLAVYFVVSNLLSVAQYALMGRVNWRNLLPQKKSEAGTSITTTGGKK